jgi:hypothetical protein
MELEILTMPGQCTIWAHVDFDGDGRVSRGDFVTEAVYPVPPGVQPRVTVRVSEV